MPELSEFERIAYADQCTNTSEIISVKALDNMILVFSIFSSLSTKFSTFSKLYTSSPVKKNTSFRFFPPFHIFPTMRPTGEKVRYSLLLCGFADSFSQIHSPYY